MQVHVTSETTATNGRIDSGIVSDEIEQVQISNNLQNYAAANGTEEISLTQFLEEIDNIPDTDNDPLPTETTAQATETAQSEEIPNELNEPMTDNGRKRGVISDQIEPKINNTTFEIEFYEKDQTTQELIERAIAANDFLNNLMDVDRLNLVVKAMKPMEFEADSIIIKEGEDGSHFFVSADGEFQVVKGTEVKTTFKAGVVFGELGKHFFNIFFVAHELRFFLNKIYLNLMPTVTNIQNCFFREICSHLLFISQPDFITSLHIASHLLFMFKLLYLQVFCIRRNDLHRFVPQQRQKCGLSNDEHFKKLL